MLRAASSTACYDIHSSCPHHGIDLEPRYVQDYKITLEQYTQSVWRSYLLLLLYCYSSLNIHWHHPTSGAGIRASGCHCASAH